MTAAFFPTQFGEIEVRFGVTRPAHSVYVRRRLLVGLLLLAVVAVVGLSVHTVLADRGGVPASAPTIRSANRSANRSATVAIAPGAVPSAVPSAAPVAMPVVPDTATAITYIVQPGDSLWNLAERFRGSHSLSGYVEDLVKANHGSVVQLGQVLVLP